MRGSGAGRRKICFGTPAWESKTRWSPDTENNRHDWPGVLREPADSKHRRQQRGQAETQHILPRGDLGVDGAVSLRRDRIAAEVFHVLYRHLHRIVGDKAQAAQENGMRSGAVARGLRRLGLSERAAQRVM